MARKVERLRGWRREWRRWRTFDRKCVVVLLLLATAFRGLAFALLAHGILCSSEFWNKIPSEAMHDGTDAL